MTEHKTYSYNNWKPLLHEPVFLAPGARVVGRVEIGKNSSVWYNVVIRGDVDEVKIGCGTNIQDGAVVHEDEGYPCVVGDNVVVGHNAILHGCTIEDNVVIGMGAIVLSGAKIGANSVVAAGALIPGSREIPPNSMAVGTPAKVVRELTPEEKKIFGALAKRYEKRAMCCLGLGASPDF
ncbi:MAG: gamma carbonic anhydrase family protein [Desulfotomaculaceae bacterium]